MSSRQLLDRILDWARGEEGVVAVALTGSRARADGRVDQFSDFDLQIITDAARALLEDDSWLDGLGEVWIRFPLDSAAPYRLVWFAGGRKVDFQFISPAEIQGMRESGWLSDEYLRGYTVLLDKGALFSGLPPSPQTFPSPPAPAERELLAVVNEFYFEAIHVAQFIHRRDFWVVKHRDWTMKQCLLRALEWHGQVCRDERPNTWTLGRRIREWAGDETYERLTRLWAGWEAPALWRALDLQLALFRELCGELARALGCDLDEARYQAIEAYIAELRRDDLATD